MIGLFIVIGLVYAMCAFIRFGLRGNFRYAGRESNWQSLGWALIWPQGVWNWLNDGKLK
jgi:hypothetical protein